MEGKGIKVFGVVMALLLVFSFAAAFSVSSTSVVSAGTQKWTNISIPGIDDMQLAPGTAVADIAVSPDGETLFAALYVDDDTDLPAQYDTTATPGYDWFVVKSLDQGYTWRQTGITSTYLQSVLDTTDIVDIEVSPGWEDDGIVVVATQYDVYFSDDRGGEFESMNADAIADPITSLDVALNDDGNATYLIGTSGANGEVYLMSGSGFAGWQEQYIEDPGGTGYGPTGSAYEFDPTAMGYTGVATGGVLDVAFSPNYDQDGVIFAVVCGYAPMNFYMGTYLRAESDIEVNNWGTYISDAPFMDEEDDENIVARSACMAFAEDYNSQPAVFVGLTAYDSDVGLLDPLWPTTEPRGDVFRVDLVSGSLGASAVEDLNVRPDARTNIYSIDVSGNSGSAFILVGTTDLSQSGGTSNWQAGASYSSSGGEGWFPCLKPPAGTIIDMTDNHLGHMAPTMLLAPDFADSGIAYCGTGYDLWFTPAGCGISSMFHGFFASTTDATTWNGRGLLYYTIDDISDVKPSPEYDNDSTLFLVTEHTGYVYGFGNFGTLWKSIDGGKFWELILSMNLAAPSPGFHINSVEVGAEYPNEPTVLVYAPEGCLGANSAFQRSVDEGNLWTTAIRGPFDGTTPLPLDAWKVIDQDTIIGASGRDLWFTTDAGAHWIKSGGSSSTNDIGASENVVDMQLWDDETVLVGTDSGNVYICQNWETDFSFTQIDQGPGAAGDWIYTAFDASYDDNGYIYAGIWGPPNDGIWRIDVNSGDEWEKIYVAGEDIFSIACDGNGILWATTDTGVPVRQVNPTAPIDDILPGGESEFEYVDAGLDWPNGRVWDDLETAPAETYVFAIGDKWNDTLSVYEPTLWAYIDTLIKPILISPTDGTTAAGTIIQGTDTARVNFVWQDMAKAKMYEYQVAYDSGFGSIAQEGNLSGTQVPLNLYLGEEYYWRVRVEYDEPVFSQWSEVWSFTTPLGPASSKPVITYPGAQDSHYDIETTPTLTWTSSVECTGYELMVAANCDWSDPIINLTGSSALGDDTCYAITQALHEGTNYCWKVRAVNGDTDTMSPWSDTGTFTTLVTVVEEEEGTPVWVWVVIALSAVLLVGVVVLIIRTRRPV